MVYKFRDGYPMRGMDAEDVGAALEKLNDANGGLTSEIVVKAARAKRSPMHNAFTWDDADAARQYRLRQASSLIRAIVVESPERPVVRKFVNVTVADGEGESQRHYMSLDAALSDPECRGQVLMDAKCELSAFRRKYANLKEVAEVIEVINRVVER